MMIGGFLENARFNEKSKIIMTIKYQPEFLTHCKTI